MICKKTMFRCDTPNLCGSFKGCHMIEGVLQGQEQIFRGLEVLLADLASITHITTQHQAKTGVLAERLGTRIAELEGLLGDIYAKWSDDALYRIGDDIERIRAALEKP